MPLVNPGYPVSSFYFHSGLLNCDDKRHLFLLHYIFLPRINRVLKSFVKSWNKHPIRTENSWSPEQITTNGTTDLQNRQYQHISEIHDFEIDGYDDLTWYGMDLYAPSQPDDGLSTVTVEDVSPITIYHQALYTVNPLDESDQYGIDLFLRALNVLHIQCTCFAILRCTVLKGPVLYKAKNGIDCDIVISNNKPFHKT